MKTTITIRYTTQLNGPSQNPIQWSSHGTQILIVNLSERGNPVLFLCWNVVTDPIVVSECGNSFNSSVGIWKLDPN